MLIADYQQQFPLGATWTMHFKANRLMSIVQLQTRYLMLLLVCFAVIFYLWPFALTPLIAIQPQGAGNVILSLTSIIATLFAIFVAAALIVYELLKDRWPHEIASTLFSTTVMRNAITLYVASIILGVISALVVLSYDGASTGVLATPGANLLLLCLILFPLCLLSVYPAIRGFTGKLDSLDELTDVLARMSHGLESRPSRLVRSDRDSPEITLGEVLTRAIARNDVTFADRVIHRVTGELGGLLGSDNAYRRRGIVERFLYVYSVALSDAVTHRQVRVLTILVRVVEDIHEELARQQAPWSDLVELNEFIRRFLDMCVEKALVGPARELIRAVARMFEYHWDHNLPKETDIWFMWDPPPDPQQQRDRNRDLHWRHLESEYSDFMYRAYVEGGASYFGEAGVALYFILSHVLFSEEGGAKHRRGVVTKVYATYAMMIRKAAERGDNLSGGLDPVSSFLINEALDSDLEFASIPLRQSAVIVRDAYKAGLTRIFDINELGTVARGAIAKARGRDGRYYQAAEFCVRFFEELHEIADDPSMPDRVAVRAEIDKQVSSLEHWIKTQSAVDVWDELSPRVEALLSDPKTTGANPLVGWKIEVGEDQGPA